MYPLAQPDLLLSNDGVNGPTPELSVRRSKQFYFVLAMLVLAVTSVGPLRGQSPTSSVVAVHEHYTRAIVLGFVGGFVHSHDRRHSEVQLIRQLQETYGTSVRAEVFDNRHIREAHSFIRRALDTNADGQLSREEREQARIVLFGHSWGASAVVYLARELQRDGIPVSLTVQVDSIQKHGEDDSVIPANVHEAVNFYQTEGILHGQPEITASDPARTTIRGNYRYSYQTQPADCSRYPWHDRFFFKGHTAIECDPRVWSEVNALIQLQLPPAENYSRRAASKFTSMRNPPGYRLTSGSFQRKNHQRSTEIGVFRQRLGKTRGAFHLPCRA